jgi:hypothetical protein
MFRSEPNSLAFFIDTWCCDLCDDLFHRFDCVNASVEARGDNVRMESHNFDGHTQAKRRLGLSHPFFLMTPPLPFKKMLSRWTTLWYDPAMLGEAENQFFLSRAALSTRGAPKSKFLSVSERRTNCRSSSASTRPSRSTNTRTEESCRWCSGTWWVAQPSRRRRAAGVPLIHCAPLVHYSAEGCA